VENKGQYQTRALVLPRTPTPTVWDLILSIGQTAHQARTLGVNTANEAAIKMLVAYEHGIPLTSALSTVYVIDNKPCLAPVLMWAKILAHPDFGGYEEKRLEQNGGAFAGWEITLKRKSGLQATRRFTLEQAAQIITKGKRLIDKDNWQNYPEDVCYWRTMERAAKVVFADVCQGLYSADELGADITPEGNVIEGEVWAVSESPSAFTTIGALLEQWEPEAIIEANEGKIPATEAECLTVAEKLEGQ
jgi:hypothetical protein